MIRRFLNAKLQSLIFTLTLSFAGAAWANLGDTKEMAAKRYNASTRNNGNAYYYELTDGVVMEWYDADDICEVVCYYKMTGDMTPWETDSLSAANFPASVKKTDWIEYKSANPNVQAWITEDHHYYREIGKVPFGTEGLKPALLVATVPGFKAFMEEQSTK
jgi:hypothetical protein